MVFLLLVMALNSVDNAGPKLSWEPTLAPALVVSQTRAALQASEYEVEARPSAPSQDLDQDQEPEKGASQALPARLAPAKLNPARASKAKSSRAKLKPKAVGSKRIAAKPKS